MHAVARLMIFTCLLATDFAEKSTTGYHADTDFKRKTCRNKDSAFKATNVPTSLTCSSICASDDDCKSFFYFPTSLRCDGCKQSYSTDGQLKGAGEQTVYYNMAPHPTTTITAIDATEEEGNRYTGCFIAPCEGGQFCNYSMSTPIIGIDITSCFDFCDDWEKARVSTIAIEITFCHCSVQYNETLTADCDEPCEGNPDEICGENYTMSVYTRAG